MGAHQRAQTLLSTAEMASIMRCWWHACTTCCGGGHTAAFRNSSVMISARRSVTCDGREVGAPLSSSAHLSCLREATIKQIKKMGQRRDGRLSSPERASERSRQVGMRSSTWVHYVPGVARQHGLPWLASFSQALLRRACRARG
jgi:hypothetical protein